MNNDLIAMTFATEEGASKTREALTLMRGSKFWGLVNAVTVSRDSGGKVLVYQQRGCSKFIFQLVLHQVGWPYSTNELLYLKMSSVELSTVNAGSTNYTGWVFL